MKKRSIFLIVMFLLALIAPFLMYVNILIPTSAIILFTIIVLFLTFIIKLIQKNGYQINTKRSDNEWVKTNVYMFY